MKLFFYDRLRDEVTFKNVNELEKQIKEDVQKTADFFK